MHLLTNILILLIGSRLFGELMNRLKQPRVMGEMIAGIILGPAVLGIVKPTYQLEGISELSVFLVVLSAGLEMDFKEVMNSIKGRAALGSMIGFVLPLLAGLLLGVAFRLDTMTTVFLGLCMSVTALPVAIRILDGFKLLSTPISRFSISTAILNDVAALLMLGVILDMPPSTQVSGQAQILILLGLVAKGAVKVALFALFVFAVWRFLRWGTVQNQFIEGLLDRMVSFFGREILFGIAVTFVLFFGTVSEGLGSHFVIGTFFGGLLLSRNLFGAERFGELERTIASITEGFLAPIFFAYLGLQFGKEGFQSLWLLAAVLTVAVGSKIIAGYWGGLFIGLDRTQSLGVGIILNGRGIMELVVANIAFQKGLIGKDLFSILVVMGLFTTVITPILFRRYVIPKLKP